ncbi:BBE domain-containing protein [Chelativorans sp. YIM 93263]
MGTSLLGRELCALQKVKVTYDPDNLFHHGVAPKS